MILESRSKLYLNTPVYKIEEVDRLGGVAWNLYTEDRVQVFDGVVLTSPYVLSQYTALIAAFVKSFAKHTHIDPPSRVYDGPCNLYRDKITHQSSLLQR